MARKKAQKYRSGYLSKHGLHAVMKREDQKENSRRRWRKSPYKK